VDQRLVPSRGVELGIQVVKGRVERGSQALAAQAFRGELVEM
jgi:hypothetical protein